MLKLLFIINVQAEVISGMEICAHVRSEHRSLDAQRAKLLWSLLRGAAAPQNTLEDGTLDTRTWSNLKVSKH